MTTIGQSEIHRQGSSHTKVGLGIRGWRCVGLSVGMGGFRDQEVEMCRFKGGYGWV